MQSVCRWHCYIVDNVESALSQHCWPCIFFLLWIFVSTTIFKPKAQFFTIHFGISVLRIISKILSSVLREIKVNIWHRGVAEAKFQFQPTFLFPLNWQQAKQIWWFYCSQLFAAAVLNKVFRHSIRLGSLYSRNNCFFFSFTFLHFLLYFSFPTFSSMNYVKLFKTMKI